MSGSPRRSREIEKEPKPPWSAVPRDVKDEVAKILRSRVVRAERVYGGYAPSATFRLKLANGKRAFFKASYPAPKGSGVRWFMDHEAKNYRSLERFIRPWAPKFLGAFEYESWHILLLEDLGPRSVPPWTATKARNAARSYARFHRKTLGKRLPGSLSRTDYLEYARFWRTLGKTGEIARTASLAGRRADEAEEWLAVALPLLIAHERRLEEARPPFVLLHFDTRSDNVRIQGDRLRIFDWPFASVGPAEFDVVAFCQAVAAEGGPIAERVLGWYEEVLKLRPEMIDASLSAISGYFADRGWRPPIEGLPRVRRWQRTQLKECLRWAARRFELPEPRWVAAVAG
jgi:Ser/Thr protein kinase RdoA (MazF antagonist)